MDSVFVVRKLVNNIFRTGKSGSHFPPQRKLSLAQLQRELSLAQLHPSWLQNFATYDGWIRVRKKIIICQVYGPIACLTVTNCVKEIYFQFLAASLLESAILGGWLVGREVGQPELVVTKTIYAKVEFWTVRLVMSFEKKNAL